MKRGKVKMHREGEERRGKSYTHLFMSLEVRESGKRFITKLALVWVGRVISVAGVHHG